MSIRGATRTPAANRVPPAVGRRRSQSVGGLAQVFRPLAHRDKGDAGGPGGERREQPPSRPPVSGELDHTVEQGRRDESADGAGGIQNRQREGAAPHEPSREARLRRHGPARGDAAADQQTVAQHRAQPAAHHGGHQKGAGDRQHAAEHQGIAHAEAVDAQRHQRPGQPRHDHVHRKHIAQGFAVQSQGPAMAGLMTDGPYAGKPRFRNMTHHRAASMVQP